MSNVFYQGEDISLTIDFFNDSDSSENISIQGKEVQLLIYTSFENKIITCSTESGKDLVINRIENNHLSVDIPASLTKLLKPGEMVIEMCVKDNLSGKKQISVNSSIRIEPSKIGGL